MMGTKQTGLPVGESDADWSRQSKPAARFLRRICSASKWTGVNSEEFTRYLMREAEKVDWNDPERPTPGMHTQMSRILARAVVDELGQQADISWTDFLSNNPGGREREKALTALEKERKSLLKSILTKLDPSHPNYAVAKKKATNGRWLLSVNSQA